MFYILYIYIEWSEGDVIERFLKPIGMEFMAKSFIDNKINGAVLMCLNEDHMKEMGCAVLGELAMGSCKFMLTSSVMSACIRVLFCYNVFIGDRILFLDFLTLLKKSKRDADRSKALWSGTTPVLKCGYQPSCSAYMAHV